jgi:hypothetical protein
MHTRCSANRYTVMKLGVRQVYLHTQKTHVLLGVRQVYLHTHTHTKPMYYWVFVKCIYTHTKPMYYWVLVKCTHTHTHTHTQSPCTRICTMFLESAEYEVLLLRRAVGSTAPDVSKALRRTLEVAVTTFPVKRRNQQYFNLH